MPIKKKRFNKYQEAAQRAGGALHHAMGGGFADMQKQNERGLGEAAKRLQGLASSIVTKKEAKPKPSASMSQSKEKKPREDVQMPRRKSRRMSKE